MSVPSTAHAPALPRERVRPARAAPAPARGRPLGRRLRRYVLREISFPTLFTLGGLAALMLSRELLGFSDLLLNRGLSPLAIARIAGLQLVPLLATILPLAVLVGSLVALGRLAADLELVALEASGLAVRRVTGPVMRFGLVATLAGLALSTVGVPASRRALDDTLAAIALELPGATVRAGEVQRFGDWRLHAREVSSGGDRMRGIVVDVPSLGETVFAAEGALEANGPGGTAIVLRDGVFVSTSSGDPWRMRFESLSTELPNANETMARSNAEPFDSAPFGRILDEAYGTDASDPAQANAARRELHARLVRPTAALVLAALATPLFLLRGGRSRAGGGLLGIICLLAYYGLVQGAEGLASAGWLPTALASWTPNLLLGALAGVLYWRASDGSAVNPRREGSLLTRLRQTASEWLERRDRARRARSLEAASAARPRRRIATHGHALPRYVARSFLGLLALSFGVLLTAYLIVDVLERLQWFARFNATASEAIRFYGLRVPLLVSRIVPMSLLVATALIVSLMGVRGELTAMRSSGIPAPRGMLPVLALCALVAPLSFLLNDQVVPRANALNEVLKETEIKLEEQWYAPRPQGGDEPKAVWFLDGSRLVEAERLDPQLGIVQGLTLYELDEAGLPVSRRDARAGRHLGGGTWRLFDPVRLDLTGRDLRPQPGPPFAGLWNGVPVETDTRNLSVGELRGEIAWAEKHGYDATALRVDLAAKVAAPFACLVLPALVFLYALSGPPYPRTASALVVSVAVGVSSVLLNDVSTSLGYGGVVPAAVAGWAPTVVFAAVAAALLLRLVRQS